MTSVTWYWLPTSPRSFSRPSRRACERSASVLERPCFAHLRELTCPMLTLQGQLRHQTGRQVKKERAKTDRSRKERR